MGMDAKWIMFPVIMIEEIFVVLVQRAFTEKILNTKGRRTFNEIAAWCIYFLIFNLTTYVLTDSAVVYLLIFCGSFFSLLLYLYKFYNCVFVSDRRILGIVDLLHGDCAIWTEPGEIGKNRLLFYDSCYIKADMVLSD